MGVTIHPELWQIANHELTIRLVLAILLGGLVGLERELGGHHAGFRTHILVSLGSAAIMLLSIYGFSEFAAEANVRMDPARLAAQVISGIGFLGAGTIMRTGLTISGLTTAASLWVVAAIGLSVGAGFYFGAIVFTLLAVTSLFVLNKAEKQFFRAKKQRDFTFHLSRRKDSLHQIITRLNRSGAKIYRITLRNDEAETDAPDADPLIVQMTVKLKLSQSLDQVLLTLADIEGVLQLETADR